MLLGAIDKLNTIDGDVVEAVIADMAHDEEEASRPATTAPSSREPARSEEHTSELQSLMRISYAVFCLKKKKINQTTHYSTDNQQQTKRSMNSSYLRYQHKHTLNVNT